MIQLLAAIPTIITAVSKVTDLFQKGKNLIEEVTGDPSRASTPEELQTEIQKLPESQQNQWAEVMSKEVDKYAAQNERLAMEIGLLDTNITEKLSEDAASEIAVLRMTTRPWAVRWMVYYVLFPFFLVVVDLAQHLLVTWLPFLFSTITPFDTFEYVFGVMKFPDTMDAGTVEKVIRLFSDNGGPATFAGELYMESIPWVVSIILGYMGLREVGKFKGYSDKSTLNALGGRKPAPMTVAGKTISEGVNLVSKVRKWFGR